MSSDLPVPQALHATGAYAAGSQLFIVSVEWTGSLGFLLEPKHTRVFTLANRDSDDIRRLSAEVRKFLSSIGVIKLAMRYSPDTKQYRPNPHVLKNEAAVQLIDGLTVDMVPSASVAAWMRREAPALPDFLDPIQAKLCRGTGMKAIELAVFAANFAEDQRYFKSADGAQT